MSWANWCRRRRRSGGCGGTFPSWQTHYTSDDYTDMTWFAPTVRFYVGRAVLKAPPGFAYPEWALNALGGMPPASTRRWRRRQKPLPARSST
jgi:hypothetical protein